MKILLIAIITVLVYTLLLASFTSTFTTKKYEYKVEYNGLLWVILDRWTIIKYKSSDKPMKIFNLWKTNLKKS